MDIMDLKARLMADKQTLVIGAGRSGVAAARLLLSNDILVSLLDDKKLAELKYYSGSMIKGHQKLSTYFAGRDDIEWHEIALVILSPGIDLQHKMVIEAKRAQVPIITEIDLALLFMPSVKMIGITGTNGKSTTTVMLSSMLKAKGLKALACGNIGTPLCDLVAKGEIDKNSYLVIELSSFQLESLAVDRLDVAIILNLTPDHLDRYRTMGDYRAAKFSIRHRLKKGGALIIDKSIDIEHRADITTIAIDGSGDLPPRLAFLQPTIDEGKHHRENIIAAATAALELGLEPRAIVQGLRDFIPLPHRCEVIDCHGDITFINDSKGTTVESVKKALAMNNAPIHLLLGGVAKGESFAQLSSAAFPHVAGYYIYGQAQEKIFFEIDSPHKTRHRDLSAALTAAVSCAQSGHIILLSPGCASYDQFDDYQHRGETFRRLVGGLKFMLTKQISSG